MYGMFMGCKSLIKLDLSSFQIKYLTKMVKMFEDCESLIKLDLSSFEFNDFACTEYMFYNCNASIKIIRKKYHKIKKIRKELEKFRISIIEI